MRIGTNKRAYRQHEYHFLNMPPVIRSAVVLRHRLTSLITSIPQTC